MKYMKMIGLAALAAMALSAIAVSSASATTLDKVEGGVTKAMVKGDTLHATLATGTSALLQNTEKSLTFDTCTTSTLSGTITNAGGAKGTNVVGSVATAGLTWGTAATPCTEPTATLGGGTLEIKWTAATTGEVIGKNFEVTTKNTIFGISCVYTLGASTKLGTLTTTEATTSTLQIKEAVVTTGTFGCPGSALWTATYTVTTPDIIHLTEV